MQAAHMHLRADMPQSMKVKARQVVRSSIDRRRPVSPPPKVYARGYGCLRAGIWRIHGAGRRPERLDDDILYDRDVRNRCDERYI